MVALLVQRDVACHKEAAWALSDLSEDGRNQVLIAEAGGIAPLVTLAREGPCEDTKDNAALTLRRLAENDTIKAQILQSVPTFSV